MRRGKKRIFAAALAFVLSAGAIIGTAEPVRSAEVTVSEAVAAKTEYPVLSADKYLKPGKKKGLYTVKLPAERTLKLTLSGADGEEPVWSTNAKKTAYVENGVLYSGKKGNAVLKCKVNGAVLTVKVTVGKAKEGFTELTNVPVYKSRLTKDKVSIRFYEDAPGIAYISLSDFHKTCTGEDLSVEKQSGSLYRAVNGNASAEIDAAKNTFDSEDIISFTNMMGLVQPGMPNVYLDGFPFIKVLESDVEGEYSFEGFDLAQYDIDIRSDKNDVYLPVATLSDIYSDLFYHYAAYSNGIFYFSDVNGTISGEDPEYTTDMKESGKRTKEEGIFSCNELLFAADYFYGKPGRSIMEQKGLGERRAEEILDENGWGRVKELLRSEDNVEFAAGMQLMSVLFFDGGHTDYNLGLYDIISKEDAASLERIQQITSETMQELGIVELYQPLYTRTYMGHMGRYVKGQLRNGIYEGQTYHKEGDTAIIVFDTFMPNLSGEMNGLKNWKDYYDGVTDHRPTPEDYPEDTCAVFLDGLMKAEADPEVKKVVIDISINGGGSLDIVLLLSSLITGRSDVKCHNTLTGQTITMNYAVDRNFDRVFDEKDALVDYSDLDFAVLTGSFSFSCGNAFPAIMKDEGIAVIGEQSGGGACAVQEMATPDGAMYQISSHRCRLVNKDGEVIDDGVPVDKEMLQRNERGELITKTYAVPTHGGGLQEVELPDYDDFYDFEVISRFLDDFYGAQALPEAA